jgi:hypothetical protein
MTQLANFALTDPKLQIKMTEQKRTITFAPGCFDSFEGTQEELDGLQTEIMRMFESGEFEKNSRPVDVEELIEEDPEYAEKVLKSLSDDNQRTLQ